MIKGTLYYDYIQQREGFEVLETKDWFVIYKIRDCELFIAHMYVRPEYRKNGLSRKMTELLIEKAKEKGCNSVIGTINLVDKGASNTLIAALKSGYKLYKAHNEIIVIGISLQGEE